MSYIITDQNVLNDIRAAYDDQKWQLGYQLILDAISDVQTFENGTTRFKRFSL